MYKGSQTQRQFSSEKFVSGPVDHIVFSLTFGTLLFVFLPTVNRLIAMTPPPLTSD
jgi:hypothetical protein